VVELELYEHDNILVSALGLELNKHYRSLILKDHFMNKRHVKFRTDGNPIRFMLFLEFCVMLSRSAADVPVENYFKSVSLFIRLYGWWIMSVIGMLILWWKVWLIIVTTSFLLLMEGEKRYLVTLNAPDIGNTDMLQTILDFILTIIYECKLSVYVYLCILGILFMVPFVFIIGRADQYMDTIVATFIVIIVHFKDFYRQYKLNRMDLEVIELQSKKSKSKDKDGEWEGFNNMKSKKVKKLRKGEDPETVGWVKDDPMEFRPKKVTMRDENVAHNLSGNVFDMKTFKDPETGTFRNLSKFLRWISWDQIPQVIGSMLKHMPDTFRTPLQATEHTEHLRRVKAISQTWHTQGGIEPLKQLLIDMYKLDPKIIVEGTSSFKKNPRIYIGDPNLKIHNIKLNHEGILYFLKDATKNNYWGEGKIRSAVKNLLLANKEEDEIIEFFQKKFYLPPPDTLWNKAQDLKRLSWCVPYLPPDYYNFDSDNKKKLCTILRSMIEELRNKAFKFIRMLCKYHNMTHTEKKVAKKIRIDQFTERMRSPDIQALFLTGMKRELICDQIYNELALKFEDQVVGNAVYCVKEKLKRKEKARAIQNSRDEKMYRNNNWGDDFELQNSTWTEKVKSFSSFYVGLALFSAGFLTLVNVLSIRFGFIHAHGVVVEQIEEARRSWKDFFRSPFDWAAQAKNKLTLVQINSVFQIINLAFKKQYSHMYGHLINLGITNWDNITDITKIFSARFNPNTRMTYYFDGECRRGNAAEYSEDFDAYISGLPLPTRNDDMELHSGMGEILDSLLDSTGISDWNAKYITEMNQKFLFVRNASCMTKTSIDLFKSVVSIVCRTFFGIDPFCPEFMAFMNRIEKCFDDIHRYDQMSPVLRVQREHANAIWVIYNEIEAIRRDPLYQTIPNYKSVFFVSQSRKFDSVYQASKALNGARNERIEPTSIMFLGCPGSGKSASVKFIERAIVHLDFKEGLATIPELRTEQVYTCNFVDKFWSGYVNQKFTEIDDMFKTENKEERSAEAQEIINLINTAAYPLNMASLEEKGCTYFDSDYVFMTTNITDKAILKSRLQLGLTENKAFIRRLHLVVIRNDPISGTFPNGQTFTVDQCIPFPECEGKIVDLRTLISIIRKMRVQKIQQLRYRAPSPDEMENFMNPPEFQLESLNSRDEVVSDPYSWLIKDIKRGILEWYNHSEWRNIILLLFVAALSATSLIALYKFFTSGEVDDDTEFFNPDSSWAKGQKTGRLQKRNISVKKPKVVDLKADMEVQNGNDCLVSNYDQAFPKLMSSTALIVARWKEKDEWFYNSAQCSHMEDGWFMTPTHFFLTNGPECEFILKLEDRIYNFDEMEHIRMADGLDISLFKIPHGSQLPKALLKFLPTTAMHTPIIEGTPMRLVRTLRSGEHDYLPVIKSGTTERVVYQSEGHFFEFTSELNYMTRTQKGDSGAIVVVQGKQNRPLIVGMHVGARTRGINQLALATPVTQELIKMLITGISEPDEEPEIQLQSTIDKFPHQILRRVSLIEAYHKPTRHSMKPSLLYGWRGEPTCVPVRLTPFIKDDILIDPYLNGVRKLHQEYTNVLRISEGAVDWLLSMYPKQKDKRLLEFSEVVKGTGENFTAVNAGTSPGYPYCLSKKKGKSPWITVDDETCVIEWTPELEELINEYEDKLRNGVQIEVLWADVLKAERREIEKVNAGKTRLFASCPLHFLLLTRKYFGKLTEFMQSQCVDKAISVGINPHSIDWTIIYNRLSKTAGSVIAGDFSNYDGIVPRAVGEVVLDFVNKWYDDGYVNIRVRQLLFEHIYNATRINDDFIYQVKDGNPSGNPWTSWYNSLCQLIMWYTILTEEFDMDPTTWNIVVYGDDNVLTTMIKGLRVSDFQPHFRSYFNMEYTHFSKKDVDPYDTLETIRYLGRSFVTNGRFPWKSAPLELSVIVESTYWTNGSKIDYEVLISTIESVVTEIFHFGRVFFLSFCEEFTEWIEENLEDLNLIHSIKQRLVLPYFTIYNRNYGGFKTAAQFQLQSNLTKAMPNSISQFLIPETDQITTTRNTEYSARATAEPSVTQEVQLGTYNDVSEVTHETVNSEMIQDPYKSFNMEGFSVDKTLDREYPLGVVTWTSSQARDTNLVSYAFPDVLFNQSYIADRLKNYHYFRGSIRFTVRIVSNQFLYGACLISFMPYPSENAAVPNSTAIQRSGLPHMLVSASAADAASLDIPFICKDRVIDILDYISGQMAQVNIMVIVPLTDVVNNSAVSTSIFVTAQFIDAEVFLPITLTSFNSKGKEADKKSSRGIISGALNTMSDVASAVSSVPFISPYAEMFNSVAKPASSMFKRIGLSKPTTTAMTQVGKINPYVDINQGEGLDLAPKLGFCPTNGISTVPNVGGQSIDEMELLYVAGTPMMGEIQAVGFDNVGDTFEILSTSSLSSYDYMDNVNALFSYSAGSTKVALYIFASKYHSVRLVFWLNQSSIPASNWANCYHKVIDVQGDTTVCFTMPYMHRGFALDKTDDEVPTLYMTVVSYNQPDNTLDTPIYVVPYKAAASDYTWGGYLDTVIIQSNPRADFSRDFDAFHESVVGYSEKGLLYGEKYKSFREIIHRSNPDCSPYTPTVSGQLSVYQVGGYFDASHAHNVFTGIEKIGKFFLFHRGSVRVKMALYGLNMYPRCLMAKSIDTQYAGTAVSSITNPMVELDIPWYSDKAFGSNNTNTSQESIPINVSTRSVSDPITDDVYMFKSGGDDFSFHFLVPFAGTIVTSEYAGLGDFGTAGLFYAMSTTL
jgi:hypothetical protein